METFRTPQKRRINFVRLGYLGDGACIAFSKILENFEVQNISNHPWFEIKASPFSERGGQS